MSASLSTPPPLPLTVVLADESYGVAVLRVLEIVALPDISPAPHLPEFVAGTIPHRDGSLPVVDLRIQANPGTTSCAPRVMVVNLLPTGEDVPQIGLVVDAVDRPSTPTAVAGTKTSTDALRGLIDLKARVRGLLQLNRGGDGEAVHFLTPCT